MTLLTASLTVTGGVLISHAIYSAYEHSLLPSPSLSSLAANTTHPPLPLDIVLEALISTLLLALSIVLSAPSLRPVRFNEWAGKIEREGWEPHAEFGKAVGRDEGIEGKGRGGKGNPYAPLDERRGFWDARASRKMFADFIRQGTVNTDRSA